MRRAALTSRWHGFTNLRGHVAFHSVPVLVVGLAMVVGALAAFAFQVISARAIGPQDFGQLGAFLAIINVAAVAGAALQNAVAVGVAEISTAPEHPSAPARRGRSEATLLGLGAGALVLALSPALVHMLETTYLSVVLAAAAIPLSFWVAETLGVLQGARRSAAATWWLSGSLLIRVALVLVSLALGLGVSGVLAAVVLSIAAALVGAGIPARHLPRPGRAIFTRTGVPVLLLGLTSAWLLNTDVIVLGAAAPRTTAGYFASAAILVKAAFMLPSALSFYLLPRFVRNRDNERLTRLAQRVTVAVTAGSGLALAVVFGLAGDLVGRLVYGAKFADAGGLLLPLCLAYLPWMLAQTVLISLTAHASRPAVVVLVVAAVVQGVGFLAAAPAVSAVIWVQATVGIGVLVALSALTWRVSRGTDRIGATV